MFDSQTPQLEARPFGGRPQDPARPSALEASPPAAGPLAGAPFAPPPTRHRDV